MFPLQVSCAIAEVSDMAIRSVGKFKTIITCTQNLICYFDYIQGSLIQLLLVVGTTSSVSWFNFQGVYVQCHNKLVAHACTQLSLVMGLQDCGTAVRENAWTQWPPLDVPSTPAA